MFQKLIIGGMLLWGALAAAQPAIVPITADNAHLDGEIVFLREFNPADALTPEVHFRASLIGKMSLRYFDHPAATADLLQLLGDVQAEEMSVVAREYLLEQIAIALARVGTMDAVPALLELVRRAPQAQYLAPGCRELHAHDLYPFPLRARLALDAIHRRHAIEVLSSAEMITLPDGTVMPLELPERLFATEFSDSYDAFPALLGGALEELARSNTTPAGKLAAWRWLFEQLSTTWLEVPASNQLVVLHEAERAGLHPVAEDILKNGKGGVIIEAARVLERLRGGLPGPVGPPVAGLSRDAASAVLAMLQAHHAAPETQAFLADLLHDEALGADAAMALVRVYGEESVALVWPVLRDDEASPVAVRHALIVLRMVGTPDAREAMREFVEGGTRRDGDEMLRGKVAKWLAE